MLDMRTSTDRHGLHRQSRMEAIDGVVWSMVRRSWRLLLPATLRQSRGSPGSL